MSERKLLVADDSLTIQKVLRLALSNEGYQIEAVSDGNDASQQIPLFRPNIVLVDVSLPGKSAYTLKEEINNDPDYKAIKFVLMSSAFETVDEEKFSQLGFHGRLIKPFDPAHLRQVLSEVFEQKEALKPVPAGEMTGEMEPPKIPDDTKLEVDMPVVRPAKKPPPAPVPATSKKANEEDIRQLTESTIRMSGLDNLDWKVQESAKKNPSEDGIEEVGEKTYTNFQIPDPSIKPPTNLMDTDRVSINLSSEMEEPPSPADAYYNAPENPFGSAEVSTEIETPTQTNLRLTRPKSGPKKQKSEEMTSAIPMAPEEIQKLVSKELQSALEKIIKEQLPSIAEKVIKDEIHKMLSNPPTN